MDLTTRGAFRLFRVVGIDVYMHWSWFPWAWLMVSWTRPDAYRSTAWTAAEYVCCFLIVLLHEFGHALACRSVGGIARKVVLWPLGGIAYVAPPERPGAVLWSIAAGPLVNLVLIVPLYLLWLVTATSAWAGDYPDLILFFQNICWMNVGLLVFNLLPFYPLDGGQILHALLWFSVGRWRSLQVVSLTGVVFGIGLFVLAVVLPFKEMLLSILFSLLASFIIFRSLISFQQSRAILSLLELPRHHECTCPRCGIGPPKGTFWVCKEHCQTRFDLFATRGKCPGCGAWYLTPECPHCHRTNHIDKWFAAMETIKAAPESLEVPPTASPPAPG